MAQQTRRRQQLLVVGAHLDGERALAWRGRATARGYGSEKNSVTRPVSPSRSKPAAASTTASYSPSATLRTRVSTLPLMGEVVEVAAPPPQLRRAAGAAGADARAGRQVEEAAVEAVDERVARIGAFEDGDGGYAGGWAGRAGL